MKPTKMIAVIKIIQSAMERLEDMPCGGIGANGSSQAELDAASENGRCVDNDAVYHRSQQAWLHLNETLKLLKG